MPRDDLVFERETSLGYLINLAARRFAQALYRRLAPHDVAHGQFPLLLVLWEEEKLTQTEIARRLDIEQPTVANTLKRMERDGLVTTAPDPHHARRVLVSLTPRGRKLERPLKHEALGVIAEATRDVGGDELARFHQTLNKLIAALAR